MGNRCRCAPSDLKRYQKRFSGPLRDRFDLEARVEPVDVAALVREDETTADGPDPAIACARAAQQARRRRLGLPCVARTLADLEGVEAVGWRSA